MKRFLSFFLALALALTLTIPALAADTGEIQSAYTLYSMGLFQGMGENTDGTPVFALDESLTRAQGITLLLRLLGKQSAAEEGAWTTPFQDIKGHWAERAVGYAYTMGYTDGVSAASFGGDRTLTCQQFVTLILRALGYQESAGDFTYADAEAFAQSLGLLESAGTGTFTRGAAAEICCAALKLDYKATSAPLIRRLVSAGTVTAAQAQSAGYAAYLSDSTSADISGELSASQVYAACSPAVFYLEVYDASGDVLQTGSGFFLSSDGTAVTNYHVLEGGSSAKATLSSGGTYPVSGVYDYEADRDIALLKVEGSGFSALTKGDSDSILGGATVYAIGSPLGLENTISQGIISNVSRQVEGNSYIQTSASISAGSSGGALIDTAGRVIGITSGTFTEGQNLNLAVPINAVNGLTKSGLQTLAEIYQTEMQASLTVSQTEITLPRGYYTTVTVGYSAGVSASLNGSISNPRVCGARWVQSFSGAPSLRISGLSAGRSTVTVTLTDSAGTVLASKDIQVTVTG